MLIPPRCGTFRQPWRRPSPTRYAKRIGTELERDGYGLWAVEVPDRIPFIGFVGLAVPGFEAAFLPAIEIGWRVDARFHGHGYALEAARTVLTHAFAELGFDSVVSFTSKINQPSWRLMQRLGMHVDPAFEFDHPRIAPDNPLSRHVLYRAELGFWLLHHRHRRTVRTAWTASREFPIVAAAGDRVTVGRRDDEWPDYLWCTAATGEASWLPESVLELVVDGSATAARAYSAAELTVGVGDEVHVGERIGGWTWCTDQFGESGWLPDRVLSV